MSSSDPWRDEDADIYGAGLGAWEPPGQRPYSARGEPRPDRRFDEPRSFRGPPDRPWPERDARPSGRRPDQPGYDPDRYVPNAREGRGGERDLWSKASDEVSSWFGDRDAARRREFDALHRGKGPKGYKRSDARILEDVNDRLTDDPYLDASDIEVAVTAAEVSLNGLVPDRPSKRRAEDLAESVSGVGHVQNNLRVSQAGGERGRMADASPSALREPVQGVISGITDGER